MTAWDDVRAAAAAVERAADGAPEVAVLLGSGAGGVDLALEDAAAVPYAELPGFAAPSVAGHAGRLETGRCAGVPVVVLHGRFHAYEGHAAAALLHPVRVAATLGARTLVATCAVGGIRDDLEPGTIAVVDDHVDLAGADPLAGEHDPRFGARFVDLTDAYDEGLRDAAADRGLAGAVYGRVHGPTYETAAEIRVLRSMGVDVVGMSLVPEVVAARQAGMRVLALAIVTNRAAGLGDDSLDHAEVIAVGRSVRPRLAELLTDWMPALSGDAT